MNKFTILLLSSALAVSAETSVKLKDLPEAVQKTVAAQTKGAALKGIAKEKEKGQTVYEVETTVGGRTRDLMLDSAGGVISIEEELTLDTIPALAKAGLEKLAAGGKISKVESVTKGHTVTYEAVVSKGSKKSEVMVNADGTPAK